jgi:hypothetical protein
VKLDADDSNWSPQEGMEIFSRSCACAHNLAVLVEGFGSFHNKQRGR